MKEIWKDIPSYEGLYQVSNLGNIKSLSRKFFTTNNGYVITKEKKLKKQNDRKGYEYVNLYKDKKMKSLKVHRLVLLSFVGFSELTIDHINGIKSDNRLENLEYVSQRENNIRHVLKNNKQSKFLGVTKHKNKWRSIISVNKKNVHLGLFNCEFKAHIAYNKYLKTLTNTKNYLTI